MFRSHQQVRCRITDQQSEQRNQKRIKDGIECHRQICA